MSGSFDPQASYVPAGLRKAAKEALNQGWTAKRSGRAGWFLRSRKGTEKFYVPITAKDPDALARELRSRINKAYLAEDSAFEPGISDMPGQVDKIHRIQDRVLAAGPSIQQGPSPYLTCPDCDGEWLEIEGFMAHQKRCQENVKARLAAEQARAVAEEGDDDVEPSEERTEDVPEQAQSGTIAHEEETLTDMEQEPVERAKRRSWTLTKNDPLHRALYVAIRENKRRQNETDSKWARRLADYFIEENLLDEVLPEFEPTDEVSAARTLAQIRSMLGADETEALKAQVVTLTEANERFRTTLSTFADLASKEATQ